MSAPRANSNATVDSPTTLGSHEQRSVSLIKHNAGESATRRPREQLKADRQHNNALFTPHAHLLQRTISAALSLTTPSLPHSANTLLGRRACTLFLIPLPSSCSSFLLCHPSRICPRERDWTSLFHVVRIAAVATPIESGQLTFALACSIAAPTLQQQPHHFCLAALRAARINAVLPLFEEGVAAIGGAREDAPGTREGERGCGSDDRRQLIHFHRCHVLSTAASIHPSSFPAARPHTSSSSKRSAAGSNSSSRDLRQDAPRSRFAQTTHACLRPHQTHKGRQQTAQKLEREREREWRRQQSPASEHTHTHTTRTIRSSFFCGGVSRR